eukprot:TRINITY_DN292_c1_g2_i1.p1 TRINITY_DN292_c1_g2~~TRINITY_DN292_c1_g2_i1.p1  ORF type:complete len:143 (-),score=43.09 TRINITY_DN292_c1_g2_i1:254-682(-)
MQAIRPWTNPTFQMKVSTSLPEAQRQMTLLYRQALRSAPLVKRLYSIPMTVVEMRKKIGAEFRSHGAIDNAAVLDVLCLKGYNLLEEAVGNYTFRSTLWAWFSAIDDTPKKEETELESVEREVLSSFLTPNVKKVRGGSSFQ